MDPGLLVLVLPLLLATAIVIVRTRTGDGWMLVAGLCLAAVWLRVDSEFEGPVLFAVTSDHGLVAADLIGVAVAVVAVVNWFAARGSSAQLRHARIAK